MFAALRPLSTPELIAAVPVVVLLAIGALAAGRARCALVAVVLGGALVLGGTGRAALEAPRAGACVDAHRARPSAWHPGGGRPVLRPAAPTPPAPLPSPEPGDPRRRRWLWTGLAGIGACAVGLFWGRWLEGPRRDDDEDEPG